MASTPAFPRFFQCLHQEAEPVGFLGRGTHYSVYRAAEWHASDRTPQPSALWHDFAIIWDEDHDDRIFDVVEQMYFGSLLSPVLFIGERKGSLSVLVSQEFAFRAQKSEFDQYKYLVNSIASNVNGDSWAVEIGVFECSGSLPPSWAEKAIINDSVSKVSAYLRGLYALWDLGTKPYQTPPRPSADTFAPTRSIFEPVPQAAADLL